MCRHCDAEYLCTVYGILLTLLDSNRVVVLQFTKFTSPCEIKLIYLEMLSNVRNEILSIMLLCT